MNQPLLSVIVPCYNVEKYIDKCVSSIVNQTYPNLEILLIDDGSLDKTGAICDEWQMCDQRIKVIHKQNEGLAYARKTGIENATADYVTFVDSDDWIDKNMYADMMGALLTTDSDIADCDLCVVYEDGRTEHRVNERQETIRTMGRIESVITNLENNGWRTSFGTKILKKKLFDHIEFPKGRTYGEDMVVLVLFHHASKTVFLDKEYYCYFQRSDSISRPTNILKEMKNFSDISDAWYERYIFVKNHPEYHSSMSTVEYMTVCLCIGLLRNMIVRSQYFTDEYFKVKTAQLRSISLTQKKKLRRGFKIDYYVLILAPKCYKFFRSLYAGIIKMINKLKMTNRQPSYILSDFWGSM